MMRFRLVSATVAAALLALGPFAARSRAASCDVSWASAVSGSWSDGSRWSTGAAPTSTQNVCITASGTYTVTLTGPVTVASLTVGGGSNGQTLAISTSHTTGSSLTLNGDSTNAGTIDLTDSDAAGAGSAEAQILIGDGATLTNNGKILSDPGAAGLGTRAIDGHNSASTLVNAASGTITVDQDLQIDSGQSGLFRTSGSITIASGKKLLVAPSGGGIGGAPAKDSVEFDIDGGTITDNGTFADGLSEAGSLFGGAALKVNGGTITGAGLLVGNGTYTDIGGTGVGASFSGAGTGTYTFMGSGSASATTLAGTIGAGQRVVFSASTADGGVPVQINSNVTNNGTIELTDSDTSGTNQNEARILIGTGDTLTNDGTITSSGTHGQRAIDGQSANSTLINALTGTIDVAGDLQLDTTQNGTFTTTGAIAVESGQVLQADPNGGSATFNLNGGSVTDAGTLEIGINGGGGTASGTTFNVNGGTVTGNPIIAAVATSNFSGSGSGSFTLEGATSIFGGGTVSGTIGSSDTVTVSGSGSGAGSAAIQTSGDVVNDGTFTMTDTDTTPSTSAFSELEIPSGSSFTNEGTMNVDPGPDASGYRSIDGTLHNAGTLKVNMLLQLALHAASSIDNSGSVEIASGRGVIINGGGGTYTQSAGTTSLGGSGTTLAAAGVILQHGSLTGAGTICGPGGGQAAPCGNGAGTTELTNGGTVAPGATAATITVDGSYTQASGGTLAVGINSRGNDQLAVTGSGGIASLDGTLQVTTAAGFTPAQGQTFEILTAPSVSGQFAATTGTGPYTIAYSATSATLTAAAPTPAASFSPSSITFGPGSNTIAAGSTANQALTVTNSGHAPLTIGTLALSGAQASSFSLTSDRCSGQTVPAGNSCSVTVNFSPSTAGDYSAEVNIPNNGVGSGQQVALSGTAGAAGARASLSSNALDFGTSGLGIASAPQRVTVTNTGSAPLTISTAGLSGPDAADYRVVSDSCAGVAVNPGATCTTAVVLTASTAGTRTATLTYTDNAPGSPQTVALAGMGTSTGTVTGTVRNGAIPGTPPPLIGATVALCPSGRSIVVSGGCEQTTTDANGDYTLSSIAPASWTMEVYPTKPYLDSASAVLSVQAGLNRQDFTLQQPSAVPAGISDGGQTGVAAASSWSSPDAVQVALDAVPSGTPGVEAVTIADFWLQPEGSSGRQPDAFGQVEVAYRYDSAGVPRLLSIHSPAGRSSSLGSWSTGLTTAAPVGTDVRGLSVQGVYAPSPLLPLDGEVDMTVVQYSLFFGQPNSGGARDQARRPHDDGPGTGEGPTPPASYDPTDATCVPNPVWEDGAWILPDGDWWNPQTKTLTRPDGSFVYYTSVPADSDETYSDVVAEDPIGGTNYVWSVYPGWLPGDTGPTIGDEGPPWNVSVDPTDGNYFTDEDTQRGPDAGRFRFLRNGYMIDTTNNDVYSPNGAGPSAYRCHGRLPKRPPQSRLPGKISGFSRWFWGHYFDPSGAVRTLNHIPVAGARVVLSRSTRHSGPFTVVPNGSVIMSPSNRRNPDHTNQLGVFGWDVVPGDYRVTASHAGCTTAHGHGTAAHTKVLVVPPPVVGLNLVLRCPHLRRGASHTTLKVRKVPVGEVVMMAAVRGRHPEGLVKFMLGRRVLGVVPLAPRTGRATLTIASRRTSGIRAIYEGDGYNAPSSGSG